MCSDDSPAGPSGTADSYRNRVDDDLNEASGTESESSSRSVTSEPKRPSQAKVKRPPFPFEYGVCKLLFVQTVPHPYPRPTEVSCSQHASSTGPAPPPRSPFHCNPSTDRLPLFWLGVPFTFIWVENYAEDTGLGVPCTEGYYSRIPGSVDLMKTWLVITDNFYEDSGIKIDIRDVWGAEHPIITFISNRQMCDITMDQHYAIRDLLEDMGVRKEYGPR